VCAKSGLLKTPSCNEGEVTLPFLTGTQPTQACDLHGGGSWSSVTAFNTMRSDVLGMDDNVLLGSLTMPSLPEDLFPDLNSNRNQNNRTTRNRRNSANNRGSAQTNRNSASGAQSQNPITWSFNNPLLDGDEDMYFPPPDSSPANDIPEEHIGYSNEQLNAARNAEIPPEAAPEFMPETADSDASVDSAFTRNVQNEDFGYELEIPLYNPLLD
jgi:hypothetical protein